MNPTVLFLRNCAQLLVVASCFGLLSGCGTFEPVVDSTRFYSLVPVASAVQSGVVPAADAPQVGLRVTTAAGHLQRAEIAVRASEHEIRYADGHQWTERLRDAAGLLLTSGLQPRLGTRVAVSVVPRMRLSGSAIFVDVQLVACEGKIGPEGGAVFSADWRLLDGEGRVLSAGRFTAEKPGWDGRDYDALAGMLAAALDDMAAMLAPQITAALRS